MMMSLGLFVFKLSTLPYQNTSRQVNYGWGTNARFGQRPVSQFLGLGEETIKITGQLRPCMAVDRRQRHNLWHVCHQKYCQ